MTLCNLQNFFFDQFNVSVVKFGDIVIIVDTLVNILQ